jgi:hypothetical protein
LRVAEAIGGGFVIELSSFLIGLRRDRFHVGFWLGRAYFRMLRLELCLAAGRNWQLRASS